METATDSKDLQIIQTLKPQEIFESQDLIAMIDRIDAHLKSIVIDPSTEKGRKEIISLSVKVRDSKTFIEKARKEYIDDRRKFIEGVNAKAKEAVDRLQALQDRTRLPVTEYEERIKQREEQFKGKLEFLRSFKLVNQIQDSNNLSLEIEKLSQVVIDESWEEYKDVGLKLRAESHEYLQNALSARIQYESEQAELKRLREAEEIRKKKEHEEQIAREAAEKAKAEAEEKARQDAELAEKKKQAEIQAAKVEAERIEREKQEAIEKQKRAEEEARLAKERAEQEKIEAEKRAKEAAAKAEADKKAAEDKAREDERKRIAQEEEEKQEAARKREADLQHRKTINNAALSALVSNAGLTDEGAKLVVESIAKGLIPNVKISY